ncbi:hypothetical protein R2B67_00385 [Streptomyces cyaneofuscatus]|uniref:hypothetical protein n=1 Tax=Streptomyces cyaneofuscatus TaxID=66883 RepID=UPI0029530206|nr:hypothetical protein [Streptomyces cyaneofuscatus]WOP07082.1 hypothetical protein R2B67_00385 [Streptomyces cyaneofuscatus]
MAQGGDLGAGKQPSGADAHRAYALFLRAQADEAGMGAREVSDRFVRAAQEEMNGKGPGEGTLEVPISSMKFSKSHIDRLFRAQALPAPPWPFTRRFLLITNRAAGLSAEQHHERLAEAKRLLKLLGERGRLRQVDHPAGQAGRGLGGEGGDMVATLRLEVDLERARHTETRLRYALRDAQFLMTTLWSIISALRDIISSHDVLHANMHHGDATSGELARVHNETQQALVHKRVAHEEADRTVGRVRSLEACGNRLGPMSTGCRCIPMRTT